MSTIDSADSRRRPDPQPDHSGVARNTTQVSAPGPVEEKVDPNLRASLRPDQGGASVYEPPRAVTRPVPFINPERFDPITWEGPVREWLSAALPGPLGDVPRGLLNIPSEVLAVHYPEVQTAITRAYFGDASCAKYLAPDFKVVSLEGSGHPAIDEGLRRLMDPHESRRITLGRENALAYLRLFWRTSQLGYGPLSLAQARTILELSPLLVELGAGNGFNAALLRALGGSDLSMRAFDDRSFLSGQPIVPAPYTETLRQLGGPWNSDDADEVLRWLMMNAERAVGALIDNTDMRRVRPWLCRLAPLFEEIEIGNAQVLKDPKLAEHDLLLSYPPEMGAKSGDLVAQCLQNVSSKVQHIHLMPGTYVREKDDYPKKMLTTFAERGWRLVRVVPSFLPSTGPKNDLVVFGRRAR